MVEHRLDHAANVEPEPCLRLPLKDVEEQIVPFGFCFS